MIARPARARVCVCMRDVVTMTPEFTTDNFNGRALNVTWFVTSDQLQQATITVCYRKLGQTLFTYACRLSVVTLIQYRAKIYIKYGEIAH